MSACCSTSPRWFQRIAQAAGWALPSATLALLPKCPACLVGYLAVFGGLGISITVASYLRAALLILSIATLIFLGARLGCRLIHRTTRRTS